MELKNIIDEIINEGVIKFVMSKPKGDAEFKKVSVIKNDKGYFAEQFTQKQVFHKNLSEDELSAYFNENMSCFMQLNAWTDGTEHIVLISKKGHISYKKKESRTVIKKPSSKKKYLIEEGTVVPPLVDMGIFTKEGKVVRQMYDKFRQINRFIELIDDEVRGHKFKEISIIDFGCGKSYLTFIVYYYLTEIMNIKAEIVGLDLKADVIKSCNEAAKKYGYSGLRFEVGDINGYAVNWGADLIFSVPCCQHEVNSQIKSEKLSILTRYGIIKERASALITDAIRGNMLWYKGYNTQLLEFVDMSHTPKNILIRAVKTQVPEKTKERYLNEAENIIKEFNLSPTIYKLMK